LVRGVKQVAFPASLSRANIKKYSPPVPSGIFGDLRRRGHRDSNIINKKDEKIVTI
jgi:hypothetical protein